MKTTRLAAVLILSLSMALAACDSPPPTPAPTQPPATVEAEVGCEREEDSVLARSIAEQFGVPYDYVMEWVCAGETFDDILLALQTAELSGRSVEELFEMKENGGWDQVWETLGLMPDEPQ